MLLPQEPELELVQTIEELKASTVEMLHGNAERYLRLMDPEVVMIGGSGDFKSGKKAFESTYQVSQMFSEVGNVTFTNQELMQSGNYACVIWNNSQELKLRGSDTFITMFFSVSHILLKDSSGWKVVHFHNHCTKTVK